MSDSVDIDAVDPMNYAVGTVDPDAALKELGFICKGEEAGKAYWLRRLGRGYWESVIVDIQTGKVDYRKVKVNRGVFTVLNYKMDAPVSAIRPNVLKWKTQEAQEVIHNLLDSDPDALEPRSELDRLIPSKCPECGSSNVTDADEEGLIDCMNCGIWWNPLKLASSRYRYGLNQESLDAEISSLKDYALQYGLPPRVTITFSRTTPESAADGDFSETGWEDEEGVEMQPDEFDREEGLSVADLTVKFIKDKGAYTASSSDFHRGVWYSSEWQTIDYRTGTEEELNFHLVGFSEEQEKEVWEKFHQKRH